MIDTPAFLATSRIVARSILSPFLSSLSLFSLPHNATDLGSSLSKGKNNTDWIFFQGDTKNQAPRFRKRFWLICPLIFGIFIFLFPRRQGWVPRPEAAPRRLRRRRARASGVLIGSSRFNGSPVSAFPNRPGRKANAAGAPSIRPGPFPHGRRLNCLYSSPLRIAFRKQKRYNSFDLRGFCVRAMSE